MALNGVVNPDASRIWDNAETWIALRDDVTDIATMIPASPDADLATLGWEFIGLQDAEKGVPFTPEGEVKKFNGFGHTNYRSKYSKGELQTGFAALEMNAVTEKVVLPGSAPNKIGKPRDIQAYVLYRFIDEGMTDIVLVSLRPGLLELKEHSGAVEGEQESYEFTVHHSPDNNGDIFEKVGGALSGSGDYLVTLGSPSAGDFTLTYKGETTAAIAYNAAASAVKAALAALDDGYKASDWTVTGSAGGPFTITPPASGAITGSGAGLTGGTFSVAPA